MSRRDAVDAVPSTRREKLDARSVKQIRPLQPQTSSVPRPCDCDIHLGVRPVSGSSLRALAGRTACQSQADLASRSLPQSSTPRRAARRHATRDMPRARVRATARCPSSRSLAAGPANESSQPTAKRVTHEPPSKLRRATPPPIRTGTMLRLATLGACTIAATAFVTPSARAPKVAPLGPKFLEQLGLEKPDDAIK